MKKIGLLCLALVLALGTMGVGYSMWYQTVYINGQVNTGNVCVQWANASNLDPCPCPATSPGMSYYTGSLDPNFNVAAITGDPGGWPYAPAGNYPYYITDKNVACTSVDGIGTKTLTVTIYNGYPLYYNDLEVHFINCGTIPVKLTNIQITPLNFTNADSPWDPTNGGQVWVSVTDGIGTQLEPNDQKAASLIFVVQESAAQGLTGTSAYQFTITWTVTQWNEA